MNLTLNLTYLEQNDNKALILTDVTTNFNTAGTTPTTTVVANKMYRIAVAGTYDFTNLGAANNNVGTRFVSNANATINLGGSVDEVTPMISEITVAALGVEVTSSSGIVEVKDTVDLLAEFGPFATQADMVYTITAALLGDTADTELVDGLYTLTYTLRSQVGGVGEYQNDVLQVTILVYGVIKADVYEKLRAIPTTYLYPDARAKIDLSEADLCGAYLSGIESSAYIAKTEELLAMLLTLENIILNGSNISW